MVYRPGIGAGQELAHPGAREDLVSIKERLAGIVFGCALISLTASIEPSKSGGACDASSESDSDSTMSGESDMSDMSTMSGESDASSESESGESGSAMETESEPSGETLGSIDSSDDESESEMCTEDSFIHDGSDESDDESERDSEESDESEESESDESDDSFIDDAQLLPTPIDLLDAEVPRVLCIPQLFKIKKYSHLDRSVSIDLSVEPWRRSLALDELLEAWVKAVDDLGIAKLALGKIEEYALTSNTSVAMVVRRGLPRLHDADVDSVVLESSEILGVDPDMVGQMAKDVYDLLFTQIP